jgi:vesicle coat complex subunit
MKWLLAMMSQGRDISEFFPDVVKNVMAKSVEVKKMVYMYLVHYADFDKRCREIALLSINSFQKDLAGSNQLIRGLALRVMTSIRVPDVIQIQLLAVKKCATDHSPYVRKCAAIALPKLFSFDPQQLDLLEEILAQLLQDSSTMVLGSSIAAFNEICPNNFKVIHPSYRKLCHLLADLDEWTQVPVLEMMTRYARQHFMDPSPGRAAAARQQAKNRSTSASKSQLSSFTAVRRRVMKKAFYSDEEDESDDEIVMLPAETDHKVAEKGSVFTGAEADIEGDLDPDHRLLLKSSLPLLKSRNAGVVLGVASLHYYCGSRTTGTTVQLGKALVRILKNHREIQYVVLTSIITMAQEQPTMFTPYLSEFFIKSTDPIFNRLLKLDILAALTTPDNADIILRELQIYVRHSNSSFVCATIRAVGRIADVAPSFAESCMEGLMHLLNCFHLKNEIYGEVVVTLRQILQQNTLSKVSITIVHKLCKLLLTSEKLKDIPVARASIVWLISEFHDILRKLAPDVLRLLAIGFPEEDTVTKLQIANYALKLSLRLPDDENVQTMMTYVLEMARYDSDFDFRDRARFMTAIMGLAPSALVDENALELLSHHAEAILLAPKLPPLTLQGPVDLEGLPHFTLGSLSSVVGHYAKGYSPIAPWPETETDPRVRDVTRETTPLSVNAPRDERKSKGSEGGTVPTTAAEVAEKNLKSFLAGSESDSSSPTSSSSDESDSSDDDSEDEEEESDDETGSDSDDSVSSEDMKPPPPQPKPTVATAVVGRVGGMRRVGGMGKKTEEVLVPFSPMTESKNLIDLPDTAPQRFFPSQETLLPSSQQNHSSNGASNGLSGNGFSSGNGGYDLLADQFDLLQVGPSSSSSSSTAPPSSSFFNQTNPQQGMSSYPQLTPAPPAPLDDSSILAQIMDSFPKQSPAAASSVSTSGLPSAASASAAASLGHSFGPNSSMSSSPSSQRSEEIVSFPKLLLRPEIAAGLKITLLFRHGCRSSTLPGSSCLFLEISNTSSDYPVRRIRVNFPGDIRRTPVEEVGILRPGESVRLPMEMILRSSSQGRVSHRIAITCDRGQYNGELIVEPWELLSPLSLTKHDFVSLQKRMGGFSHNSATLSLPQKTIGEADFGTWITTLLLTKLNLTQVQSGALVENLTAAAAAGGEANESEWRFSGFTQKEMREERVLISVGAQR